MMNNSIFKKNDLGEDDFRWSRWNDIHDFISESEKEYFEERDKVNRGLYKKMKTSKCCSIDVCIDTAMELGNHSAFVHYFLEGIPSMSERYLSIMVEKFGEEETFKNEIKKMKLMREEVWKDRCFEYDGNSEKEYIKDGTLNKLVNGKQIPKKTDIVQIGIYKKWTSEEVNQILTTIGYDRLYPLKIEEAVEIFYLDEFCKEKYNDLKGEKKLSTIKGKINKYLKTYILDENRGFVEVKKQSTKEQPREKERHILAYKGRVGKDLEGTLTDFLKKNIDTYNKIIQSKENSINQNGINENITYYYNELLKKQIESLTKYFDATRLKEEKSIVVQERIAVRNKIAGYLANDDKYRKNLIKCKETLSKDVPYLIADRDVEFIHEACEKFYKSSNDKTLDDKKCMLNYIMGLKDNQITIDRGDGERSTLNYFLLGRRMSEEKGSEDKDKYIYTLNKHDLIQYAVATGNEDEIADFLKIAGYWDKDLVNEYNDSDGDIDRLDAILIYALRYRDRLIKEWCRMPGCPTDDEVEYLKCFPFIALLMDINRDIQYIYAGQEKKEEMLSTFVKSLIFPIRKGTRYLWYKKYFENTTVEKEDTHL